MAEGGYTAAMNVEAQKYAASARALDFVRPGMRLGLGTGSTAKHFVDLLGERVRAGLAEARLKGQRLGRPTSAARKTADVRKLFRQGISKSEIARRLEIGRTSVRRILA